MQFTSQIAAVWPEARHKVDAAQAVDMYGESLGVDPALIRSDEEVQAMAAAEAQQAQAAQAMEQAQQTASMAKDASSAEVSEDNALGAVMKRAGLI